MGMHFLPASILRKVVIILRWMSSEGPRYVFSWPATGRGKPLQLALLFYTTTGRKFKRMWVEEAARGQGIAREILNALMAEAGHAGVEILRLETGVASHAALALYEKTGFKLRAPFADYGPDPLSVFMERPVNLL